MTLNKASDRDRSNYQAAGQVNAATVTGAEVGRRGAPPFTSQSSEETRKGAEMESRVMASAMTIWCYRLAGIVFFSTGISKTIVGAWGYAIGWIMLSTAWFYLAHRVSRHPVFSINARTIEILTRPAFPPIVVPITDIKNLIVTRSVARIILHNGKAIKLPLSLLKKPDRDIVVRSLASLTRSMDAGEG